MVWDPTIADYREIAAPIWAREFPLSFEELHDLLVSHDCYLRCLSSLLQPISPIATRPPTL